MRRYQNLAPPDDPNSWFDVDGVWPTPRGTYETAEFLTGATFTATGTGEVITAWRARTTATTTVSPHYVVTDEPKIWRYDATSAGTEIADRTGTASFGNLTRAQFAQFGSVTVAVLGSTRSASITGGATVYTTSPATNFAALTDAPAGESICVVSNAVGIFNTANKDGYHFSDVGDYTNWTSGESVSGRILDPAGPILAAVEFNEAAYAFKTSSIHRLRYVGGLVKWTVERVYDGLGCGTYNAACAGATGILFAGTSSSDTGSPTVPMYWFDGANPPILVNRFTEVSGQVIVYHSSKNIFSVWSGNTVWYFDPETMMWGRNTAPFGSSPPTCKPVLGDSGAGGGISVTTSAWGKSAANTLKLFSAASHAGSGYVETTKIGTASQKWNLNRITPRVRRLVDAGTQSDSVTVSCFRELHDTSASSTPTFTESSSRYRWDGQVSDNFARLKYSFTDYDVEIEDLEPEAKPAGKN